ncbi:MAG: hypothetical protein KDA60_02040, partial [Planctomycetales bacterium]|nr:hypothetical protein [Planctomycetales bacterium]
NGCSVELVSDLHLDRESFHSLYDSSDRAFPVFDNNLYFLADTAEHENVLFRTDGESVVEVFSDFDCSFWSDGCRAQAIGVFQNDFYFMAGEGIYRTSGQTVTQIETPRDDYVSVETRPVENVTFRLSGAGVEFQDAFYVFLERHGSLVTPSDLVKLDRSHVEIINELGYFSANSQLVEVRGKLLYTGFGETGYELYSIDGQSINAVADIHAQNEDYVVGDPFFGLRSSSFPDTFLTAHDRLYFLADDGTADGLYWTDGDTVERLTDALRTDAWAPLPLAHFHGEVFFLGPNGSLRSTDGANVFDYLGLELSGEPLTSIEVLHLIGDKLFIYGSSDISTGFVVVTAVPEPATHTCLALILLVIAGVRRSIIRQLPIRFQFTPLLTPGGQRVRSLPQFPRAQLS